MVTGIAVLTGWALDVASLKTVLPGLASMKANTALCFSLCGASLALSARGQRRASRLPASAALVIGVLTLSQDLAGWHLGIDQLLFRDGGGASFNSQPGRMSPGSALCFLIAAGALVVLSLPRLEPVRAPLATAAAATLMVIGTLGVTGQLLDVARGRAWWNYTGMALHTAFAFAALGTGLLATVPRAERSAWALNRPSAVFAGSGIALLLVFTAAGFDFSRQMRQSAEALAESKELLIAVVDLGAAVDDLESSQRGFLILGDETLISDRPAVKAAAQAHLARWREVTREQPGATAVVDRVARLVAQRTDFGDSSIELRRRAGFDASQRLLATGTGVALSRAIEGELTAARNQTLQQIDQRTTRWQTSAALSLLLLPTGMITSLLALMLGLVFVNQAAARSRRAQHAVQASEQRLTGIVGSAMDAIISVDAQQRIVLFNGAAEGMFGTPSSEALGTALECFLPEGARAVLAAQTSGATGTAGAGRSALSALSARRADGTVFPIEAAISQVKVGGEAIITVILRDLSERVAAERTLRESEQRLQAVTEHLTEGLVITDTEGRSVHWNRAAIEMHGFSSLAQCLRELPEFASTFELSEPDGTPITLADWPLAQVVAGRTLHERLTLVHHRQQGWTRAFSYSGAIVTAADGRRLAYLAANDVTARRAAEAEVRELNARLEQRVHERTQQLEAKSRELEGFCYSVAHDLKAPLRGIDGYSKLLLQDHAERLDEEGRQFAGNVRTAALQMAALIDDLLSYSRQERREQTLAPLALAPFVRQQLVSRGAELQAIELRLDVPALNVVADREGLAIALRNLIDNAIKFSRPAEHPVVVISACVHNGRGVITVQDNGCGFDMRFHDRIFQIFQRLHRVEEFPGTGIGLALVRKAVERMGGRVWAESAPGAGARFHIELTLAEAGHEPPGRGNP